MLRGSRKGISTFNKVKCTYPFSYPRRAFTLIELLVVLSIIVVLMAALLPALRQARLAASATACSANLHQQGILLNSYLAHSDGYLPTLANKLAISDPGVALNDLFPDAGTALKCPNDEPGYFASSGTSYFWNFTVNGQRIEQVFSIIGGRDATHVPLSSDKEGFHPNLRDKVNVLYADGRVDKSLRFLVGSGTTP